MGQIFPRAAVQVCVISQNCLAETYLCQVLGRERLIRALTLKQFMLSSPLRRGNTVVPHAEVSRALVRAIFLVAANEFWVPHDAFLEFLREAASVLRKDARDRQTTTARENEILELVRVRLSNKEIAELLQIRVSTVKFHLSNILSKMQAKSRRDLRAVPSEQLWKMLTS